MHNAPIKWALILIAYTAFNIWIGLAAYNFYKPSAVDQLIYLKRCLSGAQEFGRIHPSKIFPYHAIDVTPSGVWVTMQSENLENNILCRIHHDKYPLFIHVDFETVYERPK